MDQPTRPSRETRDAEQAEARAPHQPDRPPTKDEEELAEEQELDSSVIKQEQDMAERGRDQRGEGRIP